MKARAFRSKAASLGILLLMLASLACQVLDMFDPPLVPPEDIPKTEARETADYLATENAIAQQTQADLQTEVAAATSRHRALQTEEARVRQTEEAGEVSGEPTVEAGGEPGDEQDEQLKGTITFPYPTLAMHRNEIILAFPTQGGEATGTINLEYDLDSTLSPGDLVVPCIETDTIAATLAGVYGPDTSRLEGDVVSGQLTGARVSGCEKSNFEPESLTGTWEGKFDPDSGKATGEINLLVDGESVVLPFEASRAP